MDFIGNARFVGQSGSTLRYQSAEGTVEVTILRPGIARIRLASTFANPVNYVVPRQWSEAPLEIRPGEPLTCRTDLLTLSIGTNPLRISFGNAQGETFLGETAIALASPSLDDRSAEASRRFQIWFTPSAEQHFYGLGHGGQQLDRLGSVRQLWNSHAAHGPGSDIGIPLLVSNRGYAVFFDNPGDARITVGRSDAGLRIVYDAEGGAVDFYFVIGSDVRAVMNEVSELLGRAPLPPRWYFGYLQSTRHFDSTAELRQLPRDLRAKQIPCDGLIFLSTYGDALGWNRMVGHLDFQPELWNDPAALLAEFTEQHFAVITHEYPVLHPDSPLFAEASAQGYLLAEGYPKPDASAHPNAVYQAGQRYIDFSNPEARRWWWQKHQPLRDMGVAGWWLDGGEGPPSTSQLHLGRGEALHNVYDLLRDQAFAEGEETDRPNLRPVLLCRSGAAGMQRLGATCWSGDIDNTFATFAAQIPLGLNLALSGVPYWGTDVGGFFHPVAETGELFARWFQFGAFCPIFRSHGRVWREHLPWAHGGEVEAICRRYAELRYRLLPYTYALAWQAQTLGLPLMRPLCLNYPDDPRTWDLGDEYLWGDDLLVAPVTREGARSWTVYLPEGAWYDFWTQERYVGPGGVEVAAPLDRLPLFVREGAIVPLGPIQQFTDERPLDEVTLLIYPGPDSHFELYDDDGRTNAYRQGVGAVTSLRCRRETGQTIVDVAEPVGNAAPIPANRTYTLQIRADRPSRVSADGQGPLPELSETARTGAGWWTEGGFIWVRLAGRAGRLVVED